MTEENMCKIWEGTTITWAALSAAPLQSEHHFSAHLMRGGPQNDALAKVELLKGWPIW